MEGDTEGGNMLQDRILVEVVQNTIENEIGPAGVNV